MWWAIKFIWSHRFLFVLLLGKIAAQSRMPWCIKGQKQPARTIVRCVFNYVLGVSRCTLRRRKNPRALFAPTPRMTSSCMFAPSQWVGENVDYQVHVLLSALCARCSIHHVLDYGVRGPSPCLARFRVRSASQRLRTPKRHHRY